MQQPLPRVCSAGGTDAQAAEEGAALFAASLRTQAPESYWAQKLFVFVLIRLLSYRGIGTRVWSKPPKECVQGGRMNSFYFGICEPTEAWHEL